MKRSFAIFFLFLFLLYHVGYMAVYWLVINQLDAFWQNRITFDGRLKKISIPMTLPYWIDQEEYRPAGGTVSLNGKAYRKVLQKYARDSVHLVLVEDTLTTHLNQSMQEWVQTLTDTSSEQNRRIGFIQSVARDYLGQDPPECLSGNFITEIVKTSAFFYSIQTYVPETDTPPPRI